MAIGFTWEVADGLNLYGSYSDDFSYALYRGISVDSKGVELEVTGHITEGVKMQAGYT